MSSLFGNLNNSQKSNSGGLFGASTTGAPQSAGGGLFSTPTGTAGGASSNQPATSGGLFSNLSTSTAPKTGGLFPTLSTNTLNTTSASTGGGSLFGGLSTSAAPTTTTAANSGGLFSGTSTTAAPAGQSSLFGGFGTSLPQASAPATSAGISSFGNLTTSVPQQNGLAASTQASSQNRTNGQNSAYFDSILDQSKKRSYTETISDDLPTLQLGLDGLRSQIRKIGEGAPSKGADGGRAHYLLAASGVDPGAAVRDLNAFTSAAGRVQPVQPHEAPDTDVETYLTNLETQTTLSMIQDGLARSVREFDAFLEENVSMEWDAQRKRIYEHFGIKPKEIAPPGGRGSFAASTPESNGGFGRFRRSKVAAMGGTRSSGTNGHSTFGKSGMQRSVIGAAGPVGSGNTPVFVDVEKKMEASNITVTGPHDRLQRDKENKYAQKVQGLNSSRLQKQPYSVCKEFSDVVKVSADTHSTDLIKAYRTLIEIVGEDPAIQSLSDPRLAKERQFASAYLEASSTPKSISLKKAIIRGGARCLEKLAFENMEEVVAKNPREANLGGIPNVINKVKAYVRLQAARKNLAGDNSDLQTIGDDYVWALVYSLLRTGHVAEANQYVNDNAPAFRSIDRSFISYIGKYAMSDDRRLDMDLQQRINNEYNQRSRIAPENSIDPYRMACYKIIGRCDLGRRALEGIPQNIEDFTWVQLILAREINRVESMANEVYGLSEVQEVIREIGNRYFSTKGGAEIGNSFGAFVFMQIAVGMFEDAVSYLYTYNYVDGVHLAVALDFYGLLRVSDPSGGTEELCSLTTRGQPQISFGPMVALYTRDFRAANVSAAVDYISLICLNQDLPSTTGQNQVMLCHEALRELVLESREFAELLGDMREDGTRVEGLIEQRIKLIGLEETSDFYRTITLHAASQADDNGRVTDAVLLYHLAGEYDSVINTINRALGEAIHTPLGQPHEKLDPLKPRAARAGQASTLSLASLDDPVDLAKSILSIYGGKAMFKEKVKGPNWMALESLVNLQAVKSIVETGQWALAIDHIRQLDLLPLSAHGDASVIRSYVSKFSTLPQPLANNMPNLIFWTITCSKNERARMISSEYGGNEGMKQQLVERLNFVNMDLTTYTSQMRYRLPAQLHEALARAQME